MNELDTAVLSLFFVFKKIFCFFEQKKYFVSLNKRNIFIYIFYIIMIIYETFK